MDGFCERVLRGESILWIDYTDYAERRLAPEGVPWTDTAGAISWYRKAQSLIGSDVVVVPLWRLASTLLECTPRLREQMCAKPKVTHPARVILASEELRAFSVGLVSALRTVLPQVLLALVIPSPRTMLVLANQSTRHDAADLPMDEDAVDAAALYLADFLRCFGDLGVDILLLEEGDLSDSTDSVEFEAYRPVHNVARHYGWIVGLEYSSNDATFAASGADFLITRPSNQVATDLDPMRVTLAATAPCKDASFDFVRVPRDAVPERVLQSLQAIRSGAGS